MLHNHNITSKIIFIPIFREFVEKYYVGLKKDNPKLPILIRECSGTQPRLWARFGEYIFL